MTDLAVAEEFAWEKLAEHGLRYDDWTFTWTNGKRQFGVCRYGKREIGLSKPLTLLNTKEHVFDTILHEIAHALAGNEAGHGSLWKAMCWEVGARPERLADEAVETPTARWIGVCIDGCEIPRHRLSKRVKNGARCAPHSLPVEWRESASV